MDSLTNCIVTTLYETRKIIIFSFGSRAGYCVSASINRFRCDVSSIYDGRVS